MAGVPPRSGSGTKYPSIPTEWRIELPESGDHRGGVEGGFGGCRSIETGYTRGHVLGQGTYGEVSRSPPAALPAVPPPPPPPAGGIETCPEVQRHTALAAPPPLPRLSAHAVTSPAARGVPLSPRCRCTWCKTRRPRRAWRPRRSRWTTSVRASPSPPSERLVGWRLGGQRVGYLVVDPLAPPSLPRALGRPPLTRRCCSHAACCPRGPAAAAAAAAAAVAAQIKILSKLASVDQRLDKVLLRDNIIRLVEIVRSGSHRVNNFKGSIYMVFEYMDHDMTGLLERSQREGRRFTPAQVGRRRGGALLKAMEWGATARFGLVVSCALLRSAATPPAPPPHLPICPLTTHTHARRSSATCASCSRGCTCWASRACCTAT